MTVMSAALCWKIYHTSDEIGDAFNVFKNENLLILNHLFGVRANMGDYERLLYEYYATT